MIETITDDLEVLPRPPKSPLPHRAQVKALREFHTGSEALRDAGGPVTRLTLAPKWVMPPVVVATSPQGAHDILGRNDDCVDKNVIHREMRQLLGENLFDLDHDLWLPRRRALQPVFTKQHVRAFGGHMARAAALAVAAWRDGQQLDLDAECRRLTLRALGHSVLGLDLDERADAVAEPLRTALSYIADRGLRVLRAPGWLPTPARHHARTACTALHRLADEILQACRADPTRDAPLVRALIAATQPATGRALSDDEICHELVAFIVAGHDTTATTLAYALWALGRRLDLQERVRAEVDQLGARELAADDVPRLGYAVQVLHEALRLCPPGAAIGRLALHDIGVDGYRVPAGSMLIVGLYAIHRDPALWDHPLDFDPERFSPAGRTGRDRWQYLPFGAGPRSCIGDHFAMLEATLALATIIRGVEIESTDAEFPVMVPFTTVAAAPIRARIRVCRRPSAGAANNGSDLSAAPATGRQLIRRPHHYPSEGRYLEHARMEREMRRL